jgi:PAS domain-containing protein
MNSDEQLARLMQEIDAAALLAARPSRAPDWRRDAEALGALAVVFALEPVRLAQALVDAALALTGAEAAGIRLDEAGPVPDAFRWVASAGRPVRYASLDVPRHLQQRDSDTGRDAPVLVREMRKLYGPAGPLQEPPHEALLVPFRHRGQPVGTVWVVLHGDGRGFDAEDLRLLQTLTRFAGAAVENVRRLGQLNDTNASQRVELADRALQIEQLRGWFDLGPGMVAYVDGAAHEVVFANQPFRALFGGQVLAGAPLGPLALGGRPLAELLDTVHRTRLAFSAEGATLAVPPLPAGGVACRRTSMSCCSPTAARSAR